jgi:hypothetical protein
MNTLSNRELASHIFKQVKDHVLSKKNESDDSNIINYIGHLIDLHNEPDNHLGSKGFVSISKDIREGFGC